MPGVTKYIDEMQRVRKAHQDKVILDEVTMAFRAADRAMTACCAKPVVRPLASSVCGRYQWPR
jgi:hypothetical protein